jgi:TetR/AcrR family transcriptional regulator, cholesterol catabolism regulator
MEERIKKESMQLFMKQGVRSVTMDDIARHMGISKRTIYEHFKDKDALVKECILSHKREQEAHRKIIILESSNMMEAIYRVMFEFMLSIKHTHPSFMSDVKKYHHVICEDLIEKYREDNIREMINLIQQGIDEGLFRSEIHVEVIARILNVQLRALSDEQVFPSSRYSVSDVFFNIIVTFTRGIATEKGIAVIETLMTQWKNNEFSKK